MLAPEEIEMLQKLSQTADKHQHVDIKVNCRDAFTQQTSHIVFVNVCVNTPKINPIIMTTIVVM